MYKNINPKSQTYTLGTSLTIEALNNVPKDIDIIYYSSNAYKNNQFSILQELCKKNNISLIEDDLIINKLSSKENCYVIGIINKYKNKLNDDNHIIISNDLDYGQLGTILRSASAFNFKNIAIIGEIDYFDPLVIRSSMGGIFHLNIEIFKSIDEYITKYNNHNIYSINHYDKEINKNLTKPYSLLFIDDNRFNSYGLNLNKNSDINIATLSSIIMSKLFSL